MFDLTTFQIFVLIGCGFLVGFSKTAGTSLSSIIIPIMVDVFPAKEATGILCLAFFIASFHAVFHYRHHIKWNYFYRLMPGSLIGLVLGAAFMKEAANDAIKLSIGCIILAMLAFSVAKDKYVSYFKNTQTSIYFSLGCGMLMGFSSIVANAGSSIMALYLLIHQEKKKELLGTLVSFFFIIDVIKIPVNIYTKVITYESLQLNGLMLPLMIVGGFAGIAFLRWISENKFKKILELMTFIGSVKLIYRPILNFFI